MQIICSLEKTDFMDDHPILTIAIPTYNRGSYLDLCLRSINKELASLNIEQRSLVKLYVSDNASSDDTTEIIFKNQSSNLQEITVVRNIENIGADKNIAQCYDSATTPYVWILGDDDVILSGTLWRILEVLKSRDVDILYLNHYWFKNSYVESSQKQQKFKVSNFSASLEFARCTHVMLTFISGLIVRTGVGKEFRSALVTSNLVQFSWILPLLRDGNYFSIFENEALAAKGGNSGGYELVNTFGNNLKVITGDILKDKPKVAKAIQNGTILKFFPGLIISFRNGASKFSDKDMAVGLHKAFGDNWRYYVFIAPLINMPLFFSRIYYYFVRVFAKFFGSIVI